MIKIIIIFFLNLLIYHKEGFTLSPPHDSSHNIGCRDCHATHGGGMLGTGFVPRGTNQDILCKSCHNPTGMAASMSSVSLHKDSSGILLVDCCSCHDPHEPSTSTDSHPGGITAQNLKLIRFNTAKYKTGALEPSVYQQKPAHQAFSTAPYNGICQTCHTITTHHTNNSSGDHIHYIGQDCTFCHTHTEGFKPPTCHDCHKTAKGATNYRRQIVNSGGDFSRASHHVTNGTSAEIITPEDCEICHKQTTHMSMADPNVYLKDPDGGSDTIYNGTGGSIKNFCMNCHDANGASAFTNPPFTSSNIPKDIKTDYAASVHNTALSAQACLSCHGGADSTRTGLTFEQNMHGSSNTKLLSSIVNGLTATNMEEEFCFACHRASGLGVKDAQTVFSKTYKHPVVDAQQPANRAVECQDCHNSHKVLGVAHNYSTTANSSRNLVSMPLAGVSGVSINYSTFTNFQAPVLGNYTPLTSSTYEYQICFKCHTSYKWLPGSPPNGLSPNGAVNTPVETDQAQEFSSKNKSGHPVVTGLDNYTNSIAVSGKKGLLAAALKTPFNTNIGTQTMMCSDCHNTDSVSPAAQGPHGSSVVFMLKGTTTAWPNRNLGSNGSISTSFCFNCHPNTTSSNHPHRIGDHINSTIYCYSCHIVVPHGGKLSRLIGDRDTMPARYSYSNTLTNMQIRSFTKAAAGSYQKSNCQAQCATGDHGTAASENW